MGRGSVCASKRSSGRKRWNAWAVTSYNDRAERVNGSDGHTHSGTDRPFHHLLAWAAGLTLCAAARASSFWNRCSKWPSLAVSVRKCGRVLAVRR